MKATVALQLLAVLHKNLAGTQEELVELHQEEAQTQQRIRKIQEALLKSAEQGKAPEDEDYIEDL